MSDTRYSHIVDAVLARPWAIDQTSFAWASIMEVLALRATGHILTDDQISARLGAAKNGPRSGGGKSRNVAVIPAYGVIAPRGNMMARTSGAMSAESIAADFRAMMDDPDVDGIVFDIDSPGGVIEGIDELAAEIAAARGVKPVAAVANHMSASAAYWAFSGADELVVTPSGMVGAIGVFTAHDDLTAAMENLGVKRTIISAGKYKAEGALGTALSEEALAAVQEQVDTYYSMMTSRIAKNRGVSAADVRNGFGEGRVVLAKKAADLGMVDRVDSLDNTIRRVAKGQVGTRSAAVALDRMAVWGEADAPALVPEAGQTFTEFVEAVAAASEVIAVEAQKRADLRASEGRTLAPALRERLATLSESFATLAQEPEPDPTPDPEPPEPTPSAFRGDLVIAEAALSGGYRI